MAPDRLPFFIRGGKVVQCSNATTANNREFHFDLLSFISIAQKLEVDFVNLTWQPALETLGRGATSTVHQAQIDAQFNLAFKRSMAWSEEYSADTNQQGTERYKAIIYELIALQLLSDHPNVIDLLGITWETDGDTEEVWPVLLTERSVYGSMSDFFGSDIGTNLDSQSKLCLCADVAQACLALHSLGIVHGDIKQENVLIFATDDGWTGKLIDFGFSCLGTSDNEMVQVACTRPWQAPEHQKDTYFQLKEARRMDVYSFGILVCRAFLSEQLSELIGMAVDHSNLEEHMSVIERIESLKSSPKMLNRVLEAVHRCSSVDDATKDVLRRLFKISLQHEPQRRAVDFSSIVTILAPQDSLNLSPVTDLRTIDRLPHTVLDIGKVLADFDDADYILHRSLVTDLANRIKLPHCPCFQSAARQLWLCYEIGFGSVRDPTKAAQHLSLNTTKSLDPVEMLKRIDREYEAKRPDRLYEKLGYETNFAFDPVQLYRIQGRISEAERSFQQEVIGRKESMGEQSKSYISLLSNLALLYAANGKLDDAEMACRSAADSSLEAYGEDSDETISAQNYLANILFRREKWAELEQLQLELIPRKQNHEDIGPKDTTTLNSLNYLVVAYYSQGLYTKSVGVARELIALRKDHLGEEHQETLVTTTWLCRALLESGDFEGLESQARELVAASERVCGKCEEPTLERKEILAAILLGVVNSHGTHPDSEKLDESLDIIEEVLSECTEEESNTNLVLFVRAQTTLICILALQGRFDAAEAKIDGARTALNALKGLTSVENVEIRRFGKVEGNLKSLKDLETQGEGYLKEVETVRKSLSHRWVL